MTGRWYFSILILFLPFLASAQSPEGLLEKAGRYYERDQLDSAIMVYQQAFAANDPDQKIEAVAGLIKVAILKSDIATADSLIRLGEQLSKRKDIAVAALCRYKLVRGEYFRNSSRFDQALQQHQEVIRLSAGREETLLTHAYALYYTALTFERLSVYDSSLIYVDRAYDIFREELDTTSLKFSGIYNGLGVCYYRANRYAEAKSFYLKSKAIAEDKLGPVSSDLAICLNNLSSISRAEENYRQAIEYSERALKIFRALNDESGISGAYYGLGVYHYFLGDYGRTKDYMEACIAIRERLFDPDHYSLIGPYEVLGIAHEESGNYEKTLHYLKKVRPKIAANYGSGSLPEGYNYENTALCFQSMDRLDSALHYIRLASTILRKQLSPTDYSLAVHFFNYAGILYQLDQVNPAREMLLRSNGIYEALGMDQSSEYAQSLALQGAIAAGRMDWPAADRLFIQALNRIRGQQAEEASSPDFQLTPNTLSVLNEYTDYLFRKYQATTDEKTLRLFESYSGIYLDLSDRFRKQFNDPYTKSILIKDNAEVYDRNIGIYTLLYQRTKKEEYLKAAYNFSEYGRTCLLRDLQDDKIRSYAGLPDSILQREQTLRKKITDLNRAVLENPDSVRNKKELFRAKEALNAHIEITLQHYPKYYDLKFNSNIPALEDIQSRIEKGHHLIEYMQDDSAYYALLIAPESADLVYLGNRATIDEAIRDWKQMIIRRDKEGQSSAGARLYRQLWQPFEEKLSGGQVTIIPIGPLFYLNFETLPSGPHRSFLIHQYNISYALSITVLFSKDDPPGKGPLLAIAPGFEDAIKQRYRDQLDTLEPPDETYLRTIRQPWSLRLAERLKKRFAHQIYTGLEATEANIKANIQKGNLLYFGTHAIANPTDPLRSKLVLAKEIGEQKEDGYLHAYELYGLPLQAELAVLNACESGLGNVQKGEGMISLAYSIHYAGCPSTVMSLWKVDEKISTQITGYFLDYLDRGYTKSEALRQAKLDYLATADPSLQHPFYWGGMVLMGKDGKLQLKKRYGSWFIYMGLGTVLILLVYWSRRFQWLAS